MILKFRDYHEYYSNKTFQVQGIGNTVLTLTDIGDLTGAAADVTATNQELINRFNLIENAMNAFTTPSC